MASGPSRAITGNPFPPDIPGKKAWANGNDNVSNTVDGSFAGRRQPEWMDPINGELSILLLKPATDKDALPDDPFIIQKSIEQAVGVIEDARPEAGGSRYVLKVRQKRQIEKLMKLRELIDGTAINIDFHETLNVRKCIVTCKYGRQISDTEMVSHLSAQRVIEVRRFTKRDPKNRKNVIPTNTLVLTFQGTTIPDVIYFGYVRVQPRPYYPSPLQCTRCHRFRHTKKYCTHSELCADCSSEHAESTPCEADPLCINCSGQHSSRSRDCPVKIDEVNIVKIKVDQDVSYAEARKRHEAAKQQGSTPTPTVRDLMTKLEAKDQEITKLRTLLQNLIKEVADLKKNNQRVAEKPTETEDKMDTSEEHKSAKRQRSKDISPTTTLDQGRSSPPLKKTSGESAAGKSQRSNDKSPNTPHDHRKTSHSPKKPSGSSPEENERLTSKKETTAKNPSNIKAHRTQDINVSEFCISPTHDSTESEWIDPTL